MHIAFEKADRSLARRVVAESGVYVAIDQSRYRGGAAGVDHHVGAGHLVRGGGPHRKNPSGFRNDRIAAGERIAPVATDDAPDVDDRDAHPRGRR